MSEYPKMLFRDGDMCRVWNEHDVDYKTVRDGDEEEEALSAGWRLTPNKISPLDHDGDGNPGGSRDFLDQLTDEELRSRCEESGITLHHRAGRAKMLQSLRDLNHE